MNYSNIAIFLLLFTGAVALSGEVKETVTMATVIHKAAFWDYDEALRLLTSMRQLDERDQKLIDKAETAIRLARIANRLDPWKGSDFGRATPWYSIDDILGTAGVGREYNQGYFDTIIAHSVRRLEAISKAVEQ